MIEINVGAKPPPQKPLPPEAAAVAHINEHPGALWQFWQVGGFLQWKKPTEGPTQWKPYYDKHNVGTYSILTIGMFGKHYNLYNIRRKP